MKTGCLIQDVRRVDLSNLAATREGGRFIVGDTANENVSASGGDASLVVKGEEFAGNVVRCSESQVIFEADRFEEIAGKLS